MSIFGQHLLPFLLQALKNRKKNSSPEGADEKMDYSPMISPMEEKVILKEVKELCDEYEMERELFEGQMKECVKFVRDARRPTNKEIPEEGVNPEDLGIVKQLISKAMLIKDPDGRKITVEIRMAEQSKKFFDWWDMFVPEVVLVEKGLQGEN